MYIYIKDDTMLPVIHFRLSFVRYENRKITKKYIIICNNEIFISFQQKKGQCYFKVFFVQF